MEQGTAEDKPKATATAGQTKAAQIPITEENLAGLLALGEALSSLNQLGRRANPQRMPG
jgi:hypothetical protein